MTEADATEIEFEVSRLTPRQIEVVKLVADGLGAKGIAVTLGIEVKTAETHRNNALKRTGTHNIALLVRWAIRNKIVVA